ncbi:MAG: cation transporter [Phycisphaerales bacterium]|nr:cation transporter [Phycisphaerales bacterium]
MNAHAREDPNGAQPAVEPWPPPLGATPRTPDQLRRRAVLLCVLTTTVVAVVELTVGWWFGLLSVFAEGLHTAADLADSLVALVLVSLAARPPDRCHPFGHGKYDSLAGIIEGFCVMGSGLWAGVMAARALLGIAVWEANPSWVALVAMGAASVAYWFVSGFVLRIAVRTGSPAVYAEGVHLRTHVYVTGGVLAALIVSASARALGWYAAPLIDPLAALLLGLVLIGIGARVVHKGYRQMLDASVPPADHDRIVACLSEFRHEFVEVHALRTRQAGIDRHVDIHLVVRPGATVEAAHDLAHRIENRIVTTLPGTRFLVHVEPATAELLRGYEERGGTGVIIEATTGQPAPEASHHRYPDAHGS